MVTHIFVLSFSRYHPSKSFPSRSRSQPGVVQELSHFVVFALVDLDTSH